MKENNPLISIITPIYNVEEYLPRCLDSIIGQTYSNIEIILVDDGSPDNAGAICDEYATKDERIQVFHTPNSGVAKARQLGVESSTGDYIVFVDPDDWLPFDAVEVLYSNMADDVDLVIGSTSTDEKKANLPSFEKNILNQEGLINQILKRSIMMGAPWCKLYRRSIFDCNSFPNVRRSQDWLMNLEVAFRVRRAVTIPNKVYNYCYYHDSSCHANFPDKQYWENYISIADQTIRRNNASSRFQRPYNEMSLMIIFDCIKHNTYVSMDDKWINNTYQYMHAEQLPLKYKLIISVLKSEVRQRFLCQFSRLFIATRKFFIS